MRKAQYHIILIVSVLFMIIYFLLYRYSFNNFCAIYTSEEELTKVQILEKMGSCKDSHLCYNNNIEYDELRRNVVNWQCDKKKINYFEGYFYSSNYNNFKDKLLK